MRLSPVLLILILICVNITAKTQDTTLTQKNLKRIFKLPNIYNAELKPEWIACFNDDSAYNKADTIQLYNDMYYYLKGNCCYVTSWIFDKNTIFTLIITHVCQEPPISTIKPDDDNLKIRFKNKNNISTIKIYHGNKLRNSFILLSLKYIEIDKGHHYYCLKMLKQKI